MKQPVRYFAIGLLTAGVILLAMFYVEESKSKIDDLSAEEMIEALKADGYRIVTEAEYITLSVQDKKEQKQETGKDGDKKDTSEDQKDEEEAKATYTINIKSGMLPSEISEVLADNQIVKDAFKFSQYLEKNNYSKYIQLGKHKVNSDMSQKELAEELTK